MVETAYKGTILLVDDVQLLRTLMRSLLVANGYRVVGEAGNGEEGLEMALRLKPDVVCLDVQMSKSDGLSVLREIRAAALMTAVIMVTSSGESEIVKTAINDGAVGYIIKPFNSGRVLDAEDGAMRRLTAAKTAAAVP